MRRTRLIPRRWWGPRRRGSALDEVLARAQAARQPAPPVKPPPMTDSDGNPLPLFEGDYTGPCRRCGERLREHGPDSECRN